MPYSNYPDFSKSKELIGDIERHIHQKYEYGADDEKILNTRKEIEKILNKTLLETKELAIDKVSAKKEPDELDEIKNLTLPCPENMWDSFDREKYEEKIEGALISRFAGCTLGAMVEGWPIEKMEKWAKEIGDEFPPVDYWSKSDTALTDRYKINKFKDYTRDEMDGVPTDDDLMYTLLGLMTIEKYGTDFTTKNCVEMWVEYLDWVWLDIKIPMDHYRNGMSVEKIADHNPYNQLICADIRSDPFGYVFPGNPKKAAEIAYKDAYGSHRRNGIYGAMFFAAAISAAFALDNPVEAIKIGLTQIPKESELAKSIRWALDFGNTFKDYKQARKAVDERFKGMVVPHTINNACITTFGLMMGGRDITKVISQTVAMGLDNDCSAATAGSIAGACIGISNVPKHWYKNFNNKIHSYINGHRFFYIDDVVKRFTKQAEQIYMK